MKLTTKQSEIILIYGWILINTAIYIYTGAKYAIDTTRFDDEASAWLNGHIELSYHFWYTGYILILALSKLFSGSIFYSIPFQCIISLIASIFFFHGLQRIFKKTSVAFFSTLALILYFPVQIWNMYLLTESIYISMILFFIWAYSFSNKAKKWKYMIIVAFISSLIRPNGGLLIITILIAYLYELWKTDKQKAKQRILFALTISIPCIMALLNYTTDVYLQFIVQSFKNGEIICGYSGWTIPIKYNSNEFIHNNSILAIIKLISGYPIEYLQLSCYRFIALWTDIRPYYSIHHNIYILLCMGLFYAFALIGIRKYKKEYSGLFILTISYAGLNSLLVMTSYADWDGRFLAPLLPVIFIWTGLGIYSIADRFFINKSTHL